MCQFYIFSPLVQCDSNCQLYRLVYGFQVSLKAMDQLSGEMSKASDSAIPQLWKPGLKQKICTSKSLKVIQTEKNDILYI